MDSHLKDVCCYDMYLKSRAIMQQLLKYGTCLIVCKYSGNGNNKCDEISLEIFYYDTIFSGYMSFSICHSVQKSVSHNFFFLS
jgi:hypothetical protein